MNIDKLIQFISQPFVLALIYMIMFTIGVQIMSWKLLKDTQSQKKSNVQKRSSHMPQ